MSLPHIAQIAIDRSSPTTVYEQIANQIIALIRSGVLAPGQRLVSTREMAVQLAVHRKTVVAAYDELLAQGWLVGQMGSGTFVSKTLPVVQPQSLIPSGAGAWEKAGFTIDKNSALRRALVHSVGQYHLDDGFPDARLAPLAALGRGYKQQLLKRNPYQRLGYSDMRGSMALRQQLAIYLNETRGLRIGVDNIMIVRGTIMGVFMAATTLVKPGETVLVSTGSWGSATSCFKHAAAHIITIPVDENGIIVDEIEAICAKYPVRMIYLTPHHNYPTTVSLKADRRLKLLALAKKYRFIIFEDDYDYDFHYQNKPLLPLASADSEGLTLYGGSFTKSISPAFRVGYLVAPKDVIDYLADYRRIIDRQGDSILENTVAELLADGTIQKHLRQSLKAYRQRRDYFCGAMKAVLGDKVAFQVPEGGLAVWTKFDPRIDMVAVKQKVMHEGLFIPTCFSNDPTDDWYNYCRLGFASQDMDELEKSVEILGRAVHS